MAKLARNCFQTVAEVTCNRFGSMPVVNEIPGDALEWNTSRSESFALTDLVRQNIGARKDDQSCIWTVHNQTRPFAVAHTLSFSILVLTATFQE